MKDTEEGIFEVAKRIGVSIPVRVRKVINIVLHL